MHFASSLGKKSHLNKNKSQVKSKDSSFHLLQKMEYFKDYGCQKELKFPLLHIWDNIS